MNPEDSPERQIHGVFTDLGTAQQVPPNWIIKDLLPPGLVFIGAPPKSFKSTFEMAMAALVAGLPCKVLPESLSQVINGGPVMGFSAEATAGELRHMMEVGLNVKVPANESILICDEPFAWRLDDPGGMEQLLGWLNDRDPRLCFIDPLRDFHSVEEKDSGGMNRLLRPLQRWAKENDSCILVVHHTKKKEDTSAGYNPDDLRGSGALFGIADGVLMLTPKGEGNLEIRATFKRAEGWVKQLKLAAYGSAQVSTEILNEVEQLCLDGVKAGGTVDEIQSQLRVPMHRVQAMIMKLYSLNLIVKAGKAWRIK